MLKRARCARCAAQMTGFCTTWSGEGDALAGTRVAASDIEFSIDIDESGTELVRARAHAGFRSL
jgi:hypothetical protein